MSRVTPSRPCLNASPNYVAVYLAYVRCVPVRRRGNDARDAIAISVRFDCDTRFRLGKTFGRYLAATPFGISEQKQQTRPLATGSDSWAEPGSCCMRGDEKRRRGKKQKKKKK